MGRSKQVFVSSPVYSVVPLFLRLFIDKSGHRWLGLQRADPAIGDSASVRSAINACNDRSVIHRSSPADLRQKTMTTPRRHLWWRSGETLMIN